MLPLQVSSLVCTIQLVRRQLHLISSEKIDRLRNAIAYAPWLPLRGDRRAVVDDGNLVPAQQLARSAPLAWGVDLHRQEAHTSASPKVSRALGNSIPRRESRP